MLDKIKFVIFVASGLLIGLCLLLSNVAYEQYQKRVIAEQTAKSFSEHIDYLISENQRINQLNDLYIENSRTLENQSLSLQVELKNAIKDQTCASVAIPDDIAKRLYQHANQIRLSSDSK